MKEIKIAIATRTDYDGYEKCINKLKKYVKNPYSSKFYIICNLRREPFQENGKKFEIVFDLNPTRPTSFNLVIDKLNEERGKQHHLLTFSKEVDLQDTHIQTMIEECENKKEKLIVVGYRLKDNILSNEEYKQYANGVDSDNFGIAYQVPWNTCALWNKNFVYEKGEKGLKFDEICEKKQNQFGKLVVKVNNELVLTDYEGMEDGLAIAKLVSNNPELKYKLINKELFWNITGDKEKHKKKMARKNIVLSTFINIKGYSIDKLRGAAIK